MKQYLSLQELIILGAENGPSDYELFCEDVDIFIQETVSGVSELFRLKIVSLKWLNNQFQDPSSWSSAEYNKLPGLYLKQCLILKYYDKEAIKAHIENFLKICNQEEDPYQCLDKYLKYPDL